MIPQSQHFAAKFGVVVFCVVCAILGAVLLSPPVVAQSETATDPSGEELYNTQCVSCHGVDATGVVLRGPSLLDEGPAAVDFVLRTGRMPLAAPNEQANRKPTRYTEAEIEAMVDYVGGLGTGPAIPTVSPEMGDVAGGGTLYRLNCAACHVATGSGSVIGSNRRAPSLAAATPTEVGEAILVGPGAMPVFAEFTPEQINDIAAYVEVLQADETSAPSNLGGVGPVAEGLAAWLLGVVPLVALTRWIGEGRNDSLKKDSLS